MWIIHLNIVRQNTNIMNTFFNLHQEFSHLNESDRKWYFNNSFAGSTLNDRINRRGSSEQYKSIYLLNYYPEAAKRRKRKNTVKTFTQFTPDYLA